MMARKRKPKVIEIAGRRWFRKSYGNTYCTVRVLVDGDLVYTHPQEYGYNGMYRQYAEEWLAKNGYLPGKEKFESVWYYCQKKNIILVDHVSDVARERDL